MYINRYYYNITIIPLLPYSRYHYRIIIQCIVITTTTEISISIAISITALLLLLLLPHYY